MPKKAKPKSAASTPAPRKSGPSYWLFKTEPDEHSWEMQKARGKKGEPWTGVRNFVARNNMKAMQLGDLGFFYHTGEDKEIVGIVEVCALAHPDPKDDTGIWKCVDVRAVCDMPKPVTLAAAKANPKLVGHGTGQDRAALGAAGHGRGMEGSVPHGRPRRQGARGANRRSSAKAARCGAGRPGPSTSGIAGPGS